MTLALAGVRRVLAENSLQSLKIIDLGIAFFRANQRNSLEGSFLDSDINLGSNS